MSKVSGYSAVTASGVDTDDVLYIVVDGVSKKITATELANALGALLSADVSFAANKGPILADRSNGHTYRLKVTGGTLGVEQVT